MILILQKVKHKKIYLHFPVSHLSPLLPFYQFPLVKKERREMDPQKNEEPLWLLKIKHNSFPG